jgi:uncharacterized protein (TIGR00730 family)
MDTNQSRVTVFCASSTRADPRFASAAGRLGRLLADHGYTIVYGGGAVGSMGALADGVLAAGGRVVGVLPQFMQELEWGHRGLTELHLVSTMHERKRLMLEGSCAAIALPGGSGTFEETLEAITWKRLGLFLGAIVLVDQGGYYRPLIAQLERAIDESFMDRRHGAMWTVVPDVDQVPAAIRDDPGWSAAARSFATG